MTSDRPQHIEASSPFPTGSDNGKPHALRNLSEDQSDTAALKKTALSEPSENLIEQIVLIDGTYAPQPARRTSIPTTGLVRLSEVWSKLAPKK